MVWNTNLRWRLPVICLLLQVALVVLFGVFVRYDSDADPHWLDTKEQENSTSDMENEFYYRYPSKSGHPAGPPEAFPAGPPPPATRQRAQPRCTCAACCSGTGGGRGAGAGGGEAAHSPLALPTRAPASRWRARLRKGHKRTNSFSLR